MDMPILHKFAHVHLLSKQLQGAANIEVLPVPASADLAVTVRDILVDGSSHVQEHALKATLRGLLGSELATHHATRGVVSRIVGRHRVVARVSGSTARLDRVPGVHSRALRLLEVIKGIVLTLSRTHGTREGRHTHQAHLASLTIRTDGVARSTDDVADHVCQDRKVPLVGGLNSAPKY